MKNTNNLLFLALFCVGVNLHAQQLPVGYIIQFQENFSKSAAINQFEFSNPTDWGIAHSGKSYFLQYSGNIKDTLQEVHQQNIALLAGYMFSDFILEADVKVSAKMNSPEAKMYFYLGLKDTAHYYGVQIGENIDTSAQQIFVINNGIRRTLSTNENKNVEWNDGKWHKIKVIRDILAKTIKVYFDNMSVPVIEATDRTLIMGYVGFGASGAPLSIDNIKIWAPTSIEQKAGLFK